MTDKPAALKAAVADLARFEADYRNDVQRQINALVAAVNRLQKQIDEQEALKND